MDTELRASRKRRDIIETAIRLFQKYTVKKTSMDDIAEAAGASKVTVYKYFGDKDGLCSGVLSYITDAFDAEISSSVRSEASLIQKMRNYTAVYAGFISNGLKDLCVQLSAQSVEAGDNYALFQQKNEQLLRELINEAKSQGVMDSAVDDDVAYHYIDMGFSYFEHNALYRSRMQTDSTFRESFLAFVWRNILKNTPLN